jgi:hypothetical protein
MRTGIQKRWLPPALIIMSALCLYFAGSRLGSPVSARAQMQTGIESGILVIPVQIKRDSYGLAMVDTIGQTLWIYELNSRGPAHSRLSLFAARSYRYDKMLEQYNTAEPKPEDVKIILDKLGQRQKRQSEEKQDSEISFDFLRVIGPNN